MRAPLALLGTLSLLAGCARDASLPPPPAPPGPGSIQGRVVYAVAGQASRVPAPGAQVSILGTSLSAIAGADGRFYIGNVTQEDGLLLLQASTDGGGVPDRQAVIALQDIRAGPGRDIALGDVAVVENAAVRGRVTLADVGTPGGHSGTLVFVPQGPFMAQTADDGSYALPELPAGTVTLSFFRDRYDSQMIDGMVLTAGQSYTVRDVVLQPAATGPPTPGTIAGTVAAAGGDVGAAAASARSAAGDELGPVSPGPTGRFELAAPPGVYTVTVRLAGFQDALFGNVLVTPGGSVELAVPLTAAAGSCTAGVACASGCTVGQTACPAGPNGAITCTPTGFVMNGTPCGAGLTCQAGNCLAACNPGVACQVSNQGDPSKACRAASVSCATGVPVCEEVAPTQLLPPGTTCGAFQVCSAAGACVACAAGTPCAVAGSPCHAGAYDCHTGGPVCADTGAALAAGTPCGANQVCDAAGACVACQAGALCTPANPCHAGAVSCTTGAPVCTDTGTSALDGTVCGADQVCRGGACGACAVGAPCDGGAGHAPAPAAPDPCRIYATACTTGAPVCVPGANRPDNTACGSGLVCRGGTCTVPGNGLRVVTAPGALHALPNQPLAVTLQLVDVVGGPVLSPDTITLAAPAGAQAPPPAATSAADGTVTFTVTLGRAPGPQTFRASGASLFGPVDLVVTADAPADGTLVPIANASHVPAYSTASGPAAGLPVYRPFGVAVTSDGTVYFSEAVNCTVKRIDPRGVLAVVAGTGACTFNGETGAAAAVSLSQPQGLALDEPRNLLYVADSGNYRVRVVDLARGTLATVAGDGNYGPTAPYGDGGPATSAQLYSPDAVAVGPEDPPALYVADSGHSRIRRVDPSTHVITSIVAPGTCSATGPLVVSSLSGTLSGSIAFDEQGSLFLSARLCGKPTNGASTPGIARLEGDGRLTLVAGTATGVVSSGVPATAVEFADLPVLAFDGAVTAGGARRSNLFVSVPANNLVGRIDGASGRFDVVLGTGVRGTSGDFGPAVSATRDYPGGLAFRPGTRDLYVADGYGNSVSLVAGAGAAAASSASLAAVSASASAYPSQQLPAPLNAVLRDGGGAPLSGYPVVFATDPAGLPGGWIGSASASTAVDGIAGVAARPGLAVGRYGVVASFRDLHGDHVSGSPLTFDVTAVAPAAGTVFAAVNQAHVGGLAGIPGPGAAASVNLPHGLALASDGTLYFSDGNYRIHRMAPSGLVETIGGDGVYWQFADGGPATASGMEPWGLALHEAQGQLYFADQYNDRVRRIDLGTGFVHAVAGGGASNADGPATSTTVYRPSRLRVVGSWLYLSDRTTSSDRLRRVDLTTGNIETFLPNRTTRALPGAGDLVAQCVGSGPLVFWACGVDPGCSVAAAPDGRIYVSGSFCGAGTVNPPTAGVISPVFGIARVEADGSLTQVAGVRPNGLFDGQAGGACGFDAVPAIATDPAGNLWLAKRGSGATEQKVGYFQAAGGLVDATSVFHLVGTGPAGVEYVPAAATSFASPADVAVGAHVWVADGGVDAVRVIW